MTLVTAVRMAGRVSPTMSYSLALGGKNADCGIDLSPIYLHEKFLVSSFVLFFFFFLEEKVEGMDKNDSDINFGAGTVYGKS